MMGSLFLLASCSTPRENNPSPPPSYSQMGNTSEASSESETSAVTSQEPSSTMPENFSPESIELVPAFTQLTFEQPLYLTTADDQSTNLFVVERTGKIHRFENDPEVSETALFLDLTEHISAEGTEMGLLGLAFHPEFSSNGYFYVNYTTDTGTVISRFEASSTNYQVNQGSEAILMEFPQPYQNHNGGHIAFGPDGYLYISVGDGGGSGDPEGNGQDLTTIFGKLLRIDVDTQTEELPYGIPTDNPFAENEENIREEIYAYGLRNPWKFSFDEEKERLWLADVGQNAIEEIDLIQAGGNYGWNLMEGSQEYASTEQMDATALEEPVWEYDHSLGQSITGGYVYDGEKNPSLTGAYIYGDFVSGRIWALWVQENQEIENVELRDTELMISSFGLDNEKELVIVDLNGQLYHLQEAE